MSGLVGSCGSSVLLGILISVVGTRFCVNYFCVWCFLVLGTLSICSWLKSKICSSALVLYFIISALGGILFLASAYGTALQSFLLPLSLFLKLGLAPFQFWILSVLPSLDIRSSCLFLGPIKFGLLWLLVSASHAPLTLSFLALLLGLLLLYTSLSVPMILYASGSVQVIVLIVLGPSLFPLYYSIYLSALFCVSLIVNNLVSPIFAFLSLAALPPLSMFWAKLLALSALPGVWCFLVLLSSLLSFWPYLSTGSLFVSQADTAPLTAFFSILLPLWLINFSS